MFVECLRRFRFTADMPELRGAVARAVSDAWARLDDFNAAATDLAKHGAALAQCVARVVQAWPRRLAGDELWTPAERAAICADPLLRALMESAPVCDLDLERFLTCARREMLDEALATTADQAARSSRPSWRSDARWRASPSSMNTCIPSMTRKPARSRSCDDGSPRRSPHRPSRRRSGLRRSAPMSRSTQLPLARALNAKTEPLKGLIDQQVVEPLEEMRSARDNQSALRRSMTPSRSPCAISTSTTPIRAGPSCRCSRARHDRGRLADAVSSHCPRAARRETAATC